MLLSCCAVEGVDTIMIINASTGKIIKEQTYAVTKRY